MAAFFAKKKSPTQSNAITDLDNILGHIDEIIRQRAQLTVFNGNSETRLYMLSIEEAKKSINLSSSADIPISPGAKISAGFSIDNTWMEFETVLGKSKDCYYLSFPQHIQPSDRRQEPRCNLSSRENTSVSILESFGKGLGFLGSLESISTSAFSMSIQRTMDLGTERDVRFHEGLLQAGKELMLCRLKGIPGIPQIETGGTLLRISRRNGGQLVISFKDLNNNLKSALTQFIMDRTTQYQPVIRSYKRKQLAREELQKESLEKPLQAVHPAENEVPKITPAKTCAPTPTSTALELSPNPTANENPSPKFELPIKLVRLIQDGPTLLTLGETLSQELSFLNHLGSHWKHSNSIRDLIKTLQFQKHAILLVPKTIQQQSVLDYMEKLASTGATEHITVFLFAESGLSTEEVAQCRRARVKHVFPCPITDLEPFFSAILAVQVE